MRRLSWQGCLYFIAMFFPLAVAEAQNGFGLPSPFQGDEKSTILFNNEVTVRFQSEDDRFDDFSRVTSRTIEPVPVEPAVTTPPEPTDTTEGSIPVEPPQTYMIALQPLTVGGVPNGISLTPTSPAGAPKKYPTIDVTGFAQIDAVFFDQDPASRLANGDIQDYAGFRRARLATKGQLTPNTGYFFEMDFAFPGRPSFMDVWVEQQKIPILGNIRIGQFRQPLSLDAMTGVRDLMFLERALPFAFDPFRQIGVMAWDTALEERMTWAASVYRFPTDVWGNSFGDGGYGMSTRVTAIPRYDETCNEVLHLGFGYSLNNPGDAGDININNQLRYQATPETGFTNGQQFNNQAISNLGLTGPFLANTGPISDVRHNNIFNLEFAYAYQSFLWQAEFFNVTVDRTATDFNYTGAYSEMSYVLTGERHKYNKKAAAFGRVVPDRPLGQTGMGAWEVAGRWSYIDLRDSTRPYTPGQVAFLPAYLTDLTLGVNWYWNAYSKMQFNYIHAFQEIHGGPDTNTNMIALRTQFDF